MGALASAGLKMNNSEGAALVPIDVSIEFAHVSFTRASFPKEEVRIAASHVNRLIRELAVARRTWSVCILIDNKYNRLGIREISPLLDYARSLVPRIDFICFEKALPRYKEQLRRALRPEHAERIISRIRRYSSKGKGIGCSNDIALWHLIRLGVINSLDESTIIPVGAAGGYGSSSHISNTVVSVLSRHDQPSEEKAVEEILRYCIDQSILDRIERIYY